MADVEATPVLEAFAGYDQSVFLEWLEGLTDVLQCGGDPGQMDRRTTRIVGGLLFALVRAANELGERERIEARA